MRPEIKVCGVTSPAFAVEAAKAGVGYVGLIFATASPRRVSPDAGREIARAVRQMPAHPRVVGVFTDAAPEEIAETAFAVPLDVVQLHGPYGPVAVAALKGRGLEVWRLYDGTGCGEDAVLIDGVSGGRTGGTGKVADWSLVAQLKAGGRRVVLAGGLSSANIAAAAATGADVLDVNSSLETAPGVKSAAKLAALMRQLA